MESVINDLELDELLSDEQLTGINKFLKNIIIM